MTLQDYFTKAYLGLSSQGFVKSSEGDRCLYRGPNGLKCAIGHCIPDYQYRFYFEGNSASNVLELNGPLALKLNELQACHDFALSPEDMKSRLLTFAKIHDLEVPTPSNHP